MQVHPAFCGNVVRVPAFGGQCRLDSSVLVVGICAGDDCPGADSERSRIQWGLWGDQERGYFAFTIFLWCRIDAFDHIVLGSDLPPGTWICNNIRLRHAQGARFPQSGPGFLGQGPSQLSADLMRVLFLPLFIAPNPRTGTPTTIWNAHRTRELADADRRAIRYNSHAMHP